MSLRICFVFIVISLFSAGCRRGESRVDFVYFNLSSNEIWITEITGLPPEASPGRLAPVPDEGPLSVKGCGFFEPVRTGSKIKLIWEDGGVEGWPGGNYVNKTPLREMMWTREELGIPATIRSGKLRFTYLGDDKWRVTLIE